MPFRAHCAALVLVFAGSVAGLPSSASAQAAQNAITSTGPNLPDLTGTYTADDGGIYYLQQVGSTLWWAGLSLDRSLSADQVWHRGLGFTNVFRGTINIDYTITGDWSDVSRGMTLNSGTLKLVIGSSGGVTQLTKVLATGGFGATTWTQTGPLDDTLFNGSTLDIVSRFDAVHKNDGSTIHGNLKPYRDATVVYGRIVNSNAQYVCSENILGNNVGSVICSNHPVESEAPHVNYGDTTIVPKYPDFGPRARDFQTFGCSDSSKVGDGDFDMRMKVDLNKLEPDFYTTGWGDRTSGPKVFTLKLTDSTTQTKLNFSSSEGYLGLESITYGKAGTCSSLQDGTYGYASLLPGWADLYSASVLINGRPINGNLSSPQSINGCNFIQPCPYVPAGVDSSNYLVNPVGIQLKNLLISAFGNGNVDPNRVPNGNSGAGTYMRVTGTLILDCGHFIDNLSSSFPFLPLGNTCFDDNPDSDPGFVSANQNQEIHPIYSIDIINSPFRPEDLYVDARRNLTGAWGGSDGSTYYVRQIGNTIWWLGMMRDRQPTQRGTDFPIIGAKQLAPAFDAGDPPCPSSPRQCWAFANAFKGTITESPIQTVIEGDWAGVPQSTSAGSTGGHIKFYVYNHKFIFPATSSIFPVIIQKMYEPEDTTPPQSTLTIGAPQYPVGAGKPFVTSATPFTVSATDADSAVQNVWYRFFPQGSTPPAYTSLVGSSSSFTLTGPDGWYEVDTYATDNAGNDETPAHVQLVYLDNTPPVATIVQPTATQYGHSDQITLNYSVSDGSGSGVKSFTPKMDGQTAQQFGIGLASGQTIYLESMSLGSHNFSVDSVDNLNNAGTNAVIFSIQVTFESLLGDVNNLVALGCIDNISQSLIAKISAAQNVFGKGQTQTAINILSALIYELQAQAGKHISTTCHDPGGRPFNPVQLLIGDTQALQASLQGHLAPNLLMGWVVSSTSVAINGATVSLMSPSNTVVATATTDSVGFYYFANTSGLVRGGNYKVNVTSPPGYSVSTPPYQAFAWQGTALSLSNFVLN